MTQSESNGSTIDPAEVAKFAKMAKTWWDPDGPMKPLHRLNLARLAYLRDSLCAAFGRDPLAPLPLAGLKLLDVGCGGGLVSEPLARLGAEVLGIDATPDTLEAARLHAAETGVQVTYRQIAAEELAAEGARFDAVLALEIVEHVADVPAFIAALGQLMAPGGQVILSTLNRTAKSFALAIVGAEYVLRWLPRGTHDWKKFLKPSELARHLSNEGLAVKDLTGLVFNPVKWEWRIEPRDLDVNYYLRAAA